MLQSRYPCLYQSDCRIPHIANNMYIGVDSMCLQLFGHCCRALRVSQITAQSQTRKNSTHTQTRARWFFFGFASSHRMCLHKHSPFQLRESCNQYIPFAGMECAHIAQTVPDRCLAVAAASSTRACPLLVYIYGARRQQRWRIYMSEFYMCV